MTNFEKIKEEIANMNEEEFYFWKIDRSPWCVDIEKKNNCRYGSRGCKVCAPQWLKSKCEEPMPELKMVCLLKCGMWDTVLLLMMRLFVRMVRMTRLTT